jgi:hypothetical protein
MSKDKDSTEQQRQDILRKFLDKETKNMSDYHPLKTKFNQALEENSSLQEVIKYELSEQYQTEYMDYIKNSKQELLQAIRQGKDKEEYYQKKYSDLAKDIRQAPDGLNNFIESQLSFYQELDIIRSQKLFLEKETENMSNYHPLKKTFKQAVTENISLEEVLNYMSSSQYQIDYIDYIKDSREEVLQATREGKDKEEYYQKKYSALAKDIAYSPDELDKFVESQLSFYQELDIVRSQKLFDNKIAQRAQINPVQDSASISKDSEVARAAKAAVQGAPATTVSDAVATTTPDPSPRGASAISKAIVK